MVFDDDGVSSVYATAGIKRQEQSVVRAWFDEYFAGRVPEAPTTIQIGTAFDREVGRAMATVESGWTMTYGELAARLGRPSAAQAVGTAVGRNPLLIVVPCHRFTHASVAPIRYSGGAERKRWLLALEADGNAHDHAIERGT